MYKKLYENIYHYVSFFAQYTVSMTSKRVTCLNDIDCHYVHVDGAQMTDLCCFWTGSNTLPPRHQDIKQLLLKFDDGASDLPLSETCFLTMTIPSKYNTYDEFKKHMDIALKYGSSRFSFS